MENNEEQTPTKMPNLDPIFEEIEEVAKKHNIAEFTFAFMVEGVKQPLLFWKNPHGNNYFNAASLLAAVMRDLKDKVIQELDC